MRQTNVSILRRAQHAAIAAAITGCSAGLFAGPLEPAVVDARSKWVVHIDLEAARASSVGTYLESTPDPDSTEMVAKIKAEFGIDPSTDVLGITVFGGDPGERDGVAVIEMTAAADMLSQSLPAAGFKDFASLEFGSTPETAGLKGTDAWRWTMDGRTWFVARIASPHDRRWVVLAPSEARLASSIRTSLDRSGSLALAASAAPTMGSILFVSARGLDQTPEFRPDAAVLKLAENIYVDVRESLSAESPSVRTLNGTVQVGTRTPEGAGQIQQMLQGVLAFSTLAASDDADLAKLMRDWTSSIKMTAEANTFTLTMSQNSADVIKMLSSLRKRIDDKHTKPAGETLPAGGPKQ